MLLQSHAGEIHLLPALPAAWADGNYRGLCARGGFVVDVEWQSGKLVKAEMESRIGGELRVRYAEKTAVFPTRPGQRITLDASLQSAG